MNQPICNNLFQFMQHNNFKRGNPALRGTWLRVDEIVGYYFSLFG